MSVQFTAGRFKADDDNGNPLVSARLYTYAAGTTTHQNAYTTKAATTPVTYTSDGIGGQYIAMNSRGEALLFLSSTLEYTLTLKTALGAVIWTDDPPLSVDSILRANLAAPTGSSIPGHIQLGANQVSMSTQKALRTFFLAEGAGAAFDGVTDDTAAINKVILDLALSTAAGGEITFPTGKIARVNGPIRIPTNIRLNLNGCSLVGAGPTSGVMFETAYVNAGVLTSTIGTAYETHVIKNVKISNGYVYNVGKMCNFQNFNMGCAIEGVELFNARQFGTFDHCFYTTIDKCMHSGGTVNTLPSMHFQGQNNSIKIRDVTSTTAYGYLLENGSTAFKFSGCTTEGGDLCIKIKGDMLGLSIEGHYAEATLKFLDLSEAGTVTFKVTGNYINYCDVVFDDGGSATITPAIFGEWDESNFIANIGGVIAAQTYRGRMQISGAGNMAEYKLPSNIGFAATTVPTNWITSLASNIEFKSSFTAASFTDVRSRAVCSGDTVLALRRTGNTGAVSVASVPFTTITIGTTSTVDTRIVWQPNSSFVMFSFNVTDGNGNHAIYGNVYGTTLKRQDADAMVVAISNNGGYLRFSITQTLTPFGTITGSVQLVG